MSTGNKLRLLDLFSGIGGFSLGLERTGGFETVAFCEIEPYCRQVLARHWPEVRCYDDIRELSSQHLTANGIGVDRNLRGLPQPGYQASQGKAPGSTVTAPAYGESTPVLLAKYSPSSSSWRTSQLCLDGDLEEFSETWPRSGMMRSGTVYRLPTLVRLTDETGSGFWPTPRVQSATGSGPSRIGSKTDLQTAVKMWPTPQASGQSGSGQPNHSRYQAQDRKRETGKLINVCFAGKWPAEPNVGRVAHGVPSRVDRLGALGNAIVPQVAELIGRAVLGLMTAPTQE